MLGKEATFKQLRLYSKFPKFRGFSDKSLDPYNLEAVLVSALLFGDYNERVIVLAPPNHESWVFDQLDQITRTIFKGCKKDTDPVRSAKGYAALFKKIAVFGRPLQFREEPPYWVSFGFVVKDPIPSWMKRRLLIEKKG